MSESFVYDIIKREGWQEGHREGLQQGLQQGLLEDARSMVLQAIRVRFGPIPADIPTQVNGIESRMILVSLLEQAIRSETLAQFREALRQELEV